MTKTPWTDEYKAAMREFIAKRGQKVLFEEPRFAWKQADECVSTYGWHDFDAQWHITGAGDDRHGGPCEWVVPEGAGLKEKTYSQFTDTFSSNNNEVGVNVSGCHCKCGKYTDVTLRFEGTVTDVLHSILGIPVDPEVTL